jgi:hypothetical protein
MSPFGHCNVPHLEARAKLSTIPVDKPEDRFRKPGKIPLILLVSPVCRNFRQLRNMLIIKVKFISSGQIIENIRLSVTLA